MVRWATTVLRAYGIVGSVCVGGVGGGGRGWGGGGGGWGSCSGVTCKRKEHS